MYILPASMYNRAGLWRSNFENLKKKNPSKLFNVLLLENILGLIVNRKRASGDARNPDIRLQQFDYSYQKRMSLANTIL